MHGIDVDIQPVSCNLGQHFRPQRPDKTARVNRSPVAKIQQRRGGMQVHRR
jgi:hypothetical protein